MLQTVIHPGITEQYKVISCSELLIRIEDRVSYRPKLIIINFQLSQRLLTPYETFIHLFESGN